MSDALAARLIRRCEGCRLEAYQDSKGLWTIGVGSILVDGLPVRPGMTITQERADALLESELASKSRAVDAAITQPMTDGQRAAMISLAYNIGVSAFRASTLVRKFNASDAAGAAAEFPKWVYAGGHIIQGLVNRRKLERAVFEGSATV